MIATSSGQTPLTFGGSMRGYLGRTLILAAIPTAVMCMWSTYGNLTEFEHTVGFALLVATAGTPGLLAFFLPAAACAAWLFVESSLAGRSRIRVTILVGLAALLLAGFAAPWSMHWALHHVYLPAIGPTNPQIPHGNANDLFRLAWWALDSQRGDEAALMAASALRPVVLAVVASVLAVIGSFVANGQAAASHRDQAFVAFAIAVTYMIFFMPWLTRSSGIMSELLPLVPATCMLVTMLWARRTPRTA